MILLSKIKRGIHTDFGMSATVDAGGTVISADADCVRAVASERERDAGSRSAGCSRFKMTMVGFFSFH